MFESHRFSFLKPACYCPSIQTPGRINWNDFNWKKKVTSAWIPEMMLLLLLKLLSQTSVVNISAPQGNLSPLHFYFLVAASFLFNELCWLKINAKCVLFGAKWELYSRRKPLSNSEELLQRGWDEISTYVILEKGVRTVKNTFWLKWYRPGFWAFQEEIV